MEKPKNDAKQIVMDAVDVVEGRVKKNPIVDTPEKRAKYVWLYYAINFVVLLPSIMVVLANMNAIISGDNSMATLSITSFIGLVTLMSAISTSRFADDYVKYGKDMPQRGFAVRILVAMSNVLVTVILYASGGILFWMSLVFTFIGIAYLTKSAVNG